MDEVLAAVSFRCVMPDAPSDAPAPALSTPSGRGSAGWQPAEEGLALGLGLRVLRADVIPIWPWWRRTHAPDGFWRLYRHDGDGAWLELPRAGTVAIPAGQPVVIPSGVGFACHPAPGVSQLYIHFDVLMPEPLVRRCFPRPVALRREPVLEALLGDLAQRWPSASRGAGLHLRLQAATALALAPLVDELAPGQARQLRDLLAGSHPLAGLQAFVREHLARPLAVADLSAATGLQRNRLGVLCRERFGCTPAQLIVRERLLAAEDRLAHTAEPIESIAAACGFGNRFYFTRVFTRRHGCGPAAWRARAALRG